MTGAEPAGTLRAGNRLRFRYSKLGKVRFTSHRDVVRMWERGLRRSGLAVAWSEGFSPHLLMSFGLALPTGAESLAEYLDVVLAHPIPGDPVSADPVSAEPISDDFSHGALAGLPQALSSLLPHGVDVVAVGTLRDGAGSLQEEVSSCTWKLEVVGVSAAELASRVERLLAAPSVPIERVRKGRAVRDDLRPAVLALSVGVSPDDRLPAATSLGDGVWLDVELATQPRGVRPRELLEGLGPEVRLSQARRMHQWIERDGARCEPLVCRGDDAGADATPAPRRAS
ncbi:MAG: TIGR03936 family radical SAM-associated protein [Acidimicrobiales bacterium]